MSSLRIALAGQLGAGCTEVAEAIARETGAKVYNSESILKRLVVERGESFAGFQEHIRSGEINLDRILESYTYEVANAESKIVIEGRAAFFFLPRKNFLKVLLVADERYRAEHISKTRGISLSEAMREVEASDEEREALVRRFYKLDWLNPCLYHLVVNTTGLDMSKVAKLVLEAYTIML
ncbi:MAG: cytidylate kinase family protein [Nitrososphaerota archaeon]|nr:cytidylate kinase family protein [Candidatus Bathyarchaeota archaeon]MDW8062427.1 cytidylate kinase family protein [Nitrososphaerota archaeon]